MLRQLPNLLSASRIVFGAAMVLLSIHLDRSTFLTTLVLLVIALATDAADGYLARRLGVVSDVGYVLDAMGDRAVHLALILVFFVRYGVHPVVVWLLIFRDIGIYAVRVLSRDWLQKSRSLRWISLFHATCLRCWLGLFMVRDGYRVFAGVDALAIPVFDTAQSALVSTTIIVSYCGLFRSFGWLVDRDHDTV